MPTINQLIGKYDLYHLLEQSEADFRSGRTMSFEDSMKSIHKELADIRQVCNHTLEEG